MQTVFVCGGKGMRLRPNHAGPKSLVCLGGSTLLARLLGFVGDLHSSAKPPVVIIDAHDQGTPDALSHLLPEARVVHQLQPDGVANALLLAQPFLDEVVLVVLGDLFLAGRLATVPRSPALVWWREAPMAEIQKNFGIVSSSDGLVCEVIEKPVDPQGLSCGIGIYVLNRAVISCFGDAPVDSHTGERGITGGIQTAIEQSLTFRTVSFSGYYNNVNADADVADVERHLAQSIA